MKVFLRYDYFCDRDELNSENELISNVRFVDVRIQRHKRDPDLGEYDVFYVSLLGDDLIERWNVLDLEIS